MKSRSILPDEGIPALSAEHALFLDFDGTLAPLQDDPDTVALPPDGAACLLKLAEKLDGALVLISGRGIADLALRSPSGLWRAGGHGQDVCKPGEMPTQDLAAAPAALLEAVQGIVSDVSGARIEQKGRVIAIHYRQNPSAGPELAQRLKAVADTSDTHGFQHGKMVIELKPRGKDKGSALAGLMQNRPFLGRTPIMVGDDATDEDAMRAAIDLGGFGIKVGEGETCASYRFVDTASVWRWLRGHTNEHA